MIIIQYTIYAINSITNHFIKLHQNICNLYKEILTHYVPGNLDYPLLSTLYNETIIDRTVDTSHGIA